MDNSNEAKQRRYIEHAFQSALARLKYKTSGGNVSHLPTCANCGRLALRDKRKYDETGTVYVTCPVCGYHGKPGKPLRLMLKEV